jgi:hypothetical protein
MRSHYWSCSKFADWLRGTKKPSCATSEGWDEWDDAAKLSHPIRYWIAEEGLRYISNVVYYIPDTLHSIKYYINNRWVTRTHALTADKKDIKPGSWCDTGNRFLPCLFNELVDFVEVELAWSQIAWGDEEQCKKYSAPFWATGWFRSRTWRSTQAGLDNLEWQRNLRWQEDEVGEDSPDVDKLTQQAIKAQEILDLYIWWTDTYRNRPDPYHASGWSAVCERQRQENGGRLSFSQPTDPVLREEHDCAYKILTKMEANYEQEEEDMMIRLIRVRHGLWT